MENNKSNGIKNLKVKDEFKRIAKFTATILVVGSLAFVGGTIYAQELDNKEVSTKKHVQNIASSSDVKIYSTNEAHKTYYPNDDFMGDDTLGYVIYSEPYQQARAGETLYDRCFQTTYIYKITNETQNLLDSEEKIEKFLASNLNDIHENFEFVTLFDNAISLEEFNEHNMSLDSNSVVTIILKQYKNNKVLTK